MGKWPKYIPPLTAEQKEISNDFMKYWHEVLPSRFGIIEKFNQGFPVWNTKNFTTTLEIGGGLGEHLLYEKLSPLQEQNYYAMDIRENMATEIRRRFPLVKTIVGDCQKKQDFPDKFFDRILAIHVLEHLPDLPQCLKEMHRLLCKDGTFLVVIPTEGSLAYSLARKVSAERIYRKRYKGTNYPAYTWFYTREHINFPSEIFKELALYFEIEKSSYFPFRVPLLFCNLAVGLVLKPKVIKEDEMVDK